MRKSFFATALTAVHLTDQDELGALRYEHDPVLGDREYQYVRNKSAGTLAVNSLVGWEALSEATITAAANADLSKIIRSAGTWVAGELVGFYVRVLDDAGAAGAAPEGQVRRVTANDATTLTVDAPFTAAVTTTDTFQLHRPHYVIASADGMVASEVAGVLMATLLDGQYGWVQRRGVHPTALVVAAGTALAAGAAVKAGVGNLIVAADAADNGEIVGHNIFAVTTDTVLRTAPVRLAL